MTVLANMMVVAMAAVGFTSLPPLSLAYPPALAQDSEVSASQLLKGFGRSERGERRWQSEVPQFLLDLYNEVAGAGGQQVPAPYGATIVRSFPGEDEGKEEIFSFSLFDLKDDEEVLEVEFHVHHSSLPREQRHLLKNNTYMLEVRWLGSEERPVVGRQRVAAHSSGLRVFKLGSGVVAAGQQQDGRRVDLQVTAVTSEGRPLSVVLHHEPRGARQPLLLLFSTRAAHAVAELPPLATDAPSTRSRVPRAVDAKKCQLQDMYLYFEDFGWDFILAPRSYNAYQCYGWCPDKKPYKALQKISNAPKFNDFHGSCCNPSRYGSLVMLIDYFGTIKLDIIPDMVVKECKCDCYI